MVKGFYDDLAKAKRAEQITLEVLETATLDYDFTDVSTEEEYYHKGDIEVYDLDWDCHYYIDVKDDGVIYKTGNFLAEDQIYYKESGELRDGFMRNSTYDYVAYVSQPEQKIYMLDFTAWQKYYKQGFFKRIPHEDQNTHGYLMPKWKAREYGILLAEIDYRKTDSGYIPSNIVEYN